MLLPEGITQITESIRLSASGETLRGVGRGLSILQVMTPGIAAVILDGGSPTEMPTRNVVEGLTIRTYQAGVTGIRGIGASANTIRDVGFQGPTLTLNFDRGLHNVVDTVYVEPFEGRACGMLSIGSSDPAWYSHYTTIRAYQTRGQGSGWVAIFDRATNVSADFMVHDPGCDGILITDDCQGMMLSGWIVKPHNGVVLSDVAGRKPSFVDLRRLHIDQAADFGVRLHAGTDLDVGGQITNGGQGVLIGAYPAVERTRIDSRLATHHDNGIVALPGACYWLGSNAMISGCLNGAAIVVSNLDGNNFSITGCDLSQGNRAEYVGPQASGTRILAGNR